MNNNKEFSQIMVSTTMAMKHTNSNQHGREGH